MAPALYALICLIWGSTWLAIKIGLVGVPPFLAARIRFMLSTLLVGVVLAIRRYRLRLTREEKICVLSVGLLVFWLDYAAVYWAETHISSGLTAVLFSTMPLITSLLSVYWTRTETLSSRRLMGVLVGVFGTVLLFWPDQRLGFHQALGMLAALGASLCAAINLVMMKKYGRDADPFLVNFFGMALGGASPRSLRALPSRLYRRLHGVLSWPTDGEVDENHQRHDDARSSRMPMLTSQVRAQSLVRAQNFHRVEP